MSLNLIYVKVTPDNLCRALQIQKLVCPKNPVDRDYLFKIDDPGSTIDVSWLVYYRENPNAPEQLIGLTGVYSYDPSEAGYDDSESIWMDWFTVLPAYRGRSFGEQILRDTIAYAQSLKRFKYFRLDTSDFRGRISTHLYDKVMQLREDYTAEANPSGHHTLVYSCSLGDFAVKPWNNRFLNLSHYGAIENVVV